jgi:Concanavalin A-like lectin/glucanases superfamily
VINRHKQRGFFLNPYRFGTAVPTDPVLLLLRGNGLYTNAMADTSSYFRTVTPVGTAQVSAEQAKFGTQSIKTNGTAGYATSTVNLGDGDFTVEFWVYHTSLASSGYGVRILQLGTGADASDGFGFEAMSWNNGTWSWNLRQGYSNIAGGAIPVINTWTHVAMTKTSGGLTLFVNGVQGGTIPNSVNFATDKTLHVGWANGTWHQNSTVYFDEVRVTKGIALYTGNFTPPAAAFNDQIYDQYWWTNVALLLNMEGAHGTSTFVDNSPYQRLISHPGVTVTHTTAIKKTGTSGGDFSSGNRILQAAAAPELIMGTADFTAEANIYPFSFVNGDVTVIMGQENGSGTTGRWFLGIDTWIGSGTQTLVLYHNGSAALYGSTIVPLNQWNHVAICRYQGVTRLFLNGRLVGSTSTVFDFSANIDFRVGGSAGGSKSIEGYIDDVRVTPGIARYTANFPVMFNRLPQGLAINLDVPDYQSYVGTGTSWKDVSGYSRHGTTTSVTYDTNNGGSFSFNGSTSSVGISPHLDTTLTANFTAEVWCIPTATRTIESENTSSIGAVVTGGARFTINPNHGGGDANMGVSVGTNGVTVNEHGGSYAPAVLVYNASISNTTFTHICVVYINNRSNLYINGVFVRQGLQSLRSVHCMMNSIGVGDYPNNQFAGKIAQVRLHPRSFTADDVTKAFNASRGRYGV